MGNFLLREGLLRKVRKTNGAELAPLTGNGAVRVVMGFFLLSKYMRAADSALSRSVNARTT